MKVVVASETLAGENSICRVVRPDGTSTPLARDLRAVVIADGATCHAAALRHLLERGTALRFVASVATAEPVPTGD